jgi:putative ABC transport system ATP-binding protein
MIKVQKIYKTFRSGQHKVDALKNVSIDVPEGSFISMMGPSGSGKTTFLNIIGCLDIPTKGDYILRDKNTNALSDKELSIIRNSEIGFIFQKFYLLPYSVWYNVSLPLIFSHLSKKEACENVENALELINISGLRNKNANTLSAGEQQKVAIARAIVNNPSIICADEPTGNLDNENAFRIAELLVKLNKMGKTIILVTHDKDIAEYSSKVYHLKKGQVTKIKDVT